MQRQDHGSTKNTTEQSSKDKEASELKKSTATNKSERRPGDDYYFIYWQ